MIDSYRNGTLGVFSSSVDFLADDGFPSLHFFSSSACWAADFFSLVLSSRVVSTFLFGHVLKKRVIVGCC